ncbi:zinc-finger homeodomain protein 9 [Lactuca sativa]|uniref:ZF-HD dimerization-type domain-containing protein n=7 Tax=Lactuca TaxID=4235 RepID=A0A9R1XMT2_LACSA|nr:zinc-finger homeodomain protein 9 [Lactuca sativa]KAJ0218679.1 hypothetical protein LSAT_V11C300122210 [Lactuca sativa]
MDLKHPTTTIPEPESDTPPRSQSIKKLLSFQNGKPHHHHPPPSTVVVYKECLKNHAASIGGHALDGCGEFMPSPTCTPTDPKSLKCAACGCHRNFHRREPINDFPATVTRNHFIDFNRPYQTSTSTSTSPTPPSPPPQPTNYAFGGHLLLSLSTAADQTHTTATPMAIKTSGRKRFRTKFSLDQKEKMTIFAEKLGWKMQRCDDKLIADFCNEIGIRRGIFKVWMHNNKNNFGKREKDITTTAITGVAAAVVRSNDSTHQDNGSDDVHLQASTNGSSSSS